MSQLSKFKVIDIGFEIIPDLRCIRKIVGGLGIGEVGKLVHFTWRICPELRVGAGRRPYAADVRFFFKNTNFKAIVPEDLSRHQSGNACT